MSEKEARPGRRFQVAIKAILLCCVLLLAGFGLGTISHHAAPYIWPDAEAQEFEPVSFGLPTPVANQLEAVEAQIIAGQERAIYLRGVIESSGLPVERWDSVAKYSDWEPPYTELAEYHAVVERLNVLIAERGVLTIQAREEAERLRVEAELIEAERAIQVREAALRKAEAERLERAARDAERQAEVDRIRSYTGSLAQPHIAVMLDEMCLIMQNITASDPREHLWSACPSYGTLRDTLDNSYHALDIWADDRRLTPDIHPATYYQALAARDPHQTTLHIAVDPTDYERATFPRVIITHDLPDYMDTDHKSEWNNAERTQPYYSDVHISDDCMEALVSADVWRETLGRIIMELREGCLSGINDPTVPDINPLNMTGYEVAMHIRAYGGHPAVVLDQSQTFTAPTYEFPDHSPAYEEWSHWQEMQETCHTGWRVC